MQADKAASKTGKREGERNMKRRDFIRLGAGLGVGLGAAGIGLGLRSAAAQSKMIFKASDVHPAGYPTVVATESLGKKLEAATNGRLSVQMYPSMTLGGEKETIEQTQLGAIQLLRVSVGAGRRRSERSQHSVFVP